jgi:tape measure domain-containing protein
MTSLGDTISALGGTQDNLNSLVYVFGQMHQEAHINAGDIMQMVNQGVPALQSWPTITTRPPAKSRR